MEEKKVTKQSRKRKAAITVETAPPTVEIVSEVAPSEPSEAPHPVVKKRVTKRLVMIVVSGLSMLIGVITFISYFFTMNLFLGAPGVILGLAGFFLFRHYWSQEGEMVAEQFGTPTKETCNSLNIYRDTVLFQNVDEPKGFLWECKNDHKKYYIHIYDLPTGNGARAFNLPDRQYYDPIVFAERPLSLPAHRKIFARREKLTKYIKTAMLVVAIIIVWILIVTTTGG